MRSAISIREQVSTFRGFRMYITTAKKGVVYKDEGGSLDDYY